MRGLSCLLDLCCGAGSAAHARALDHPLALRCLLASFSGLCLNHFSHHYGSLPKIRSSHPGSLLCCFLFSTRGSQGVLLEFLLHYLPFPFPLDLSLIFPLLCCVPSFLLFFSSVFPFLPSPSFLFPSSPCLYEI